MVASYRSETFYDGVVFCAGNYHHELASVRGRIAWASLQRKRSRPLYFSSRRLVCSDLVRNDVEILCNLPIFGAQMWFISYWKVALSMGMLSAFLIIWKPKRRKQSGEFQISCG